MIEAALRREEGFWTAVLPFKFSGDLEIAGFAEGLTEEVVTGMARFSLSPGHRVELNGALPLRAIVFRRVGNELGARYLLGAAFDKREQASYRCAIGGYRVGRGPFVGDVPSCLASGGDLRFAGRNHRSHHRFGCRCVWRACSCDCRDHGQKAAGNSHALMRLSGGSFAEQRGKPEDHLLTRTALEKAVELQPGYAEAWAALSIVPLDEYRHFFNPRPDLLERAVLAAERSLDADPASQMANYAFAVVQYFRGDLGLFVRRRERAVA